LETKSLNIFYDSDRLLNITEVFTGEIYAANTDKLFQGCKEQFQSLNFR